MKKLLVIASAIAVTSGVTFANDELVKEGKKIFMTKKLGNCFACHDVNGEKVDGPGSFGPKLQYLSAWPKKALYDKVYDPYTTNSISAMPAFGKNGVLSDKQINAVVAYLKTIK
jgi:sulfur-oxidizing protein SoxX